MNYANINIVYSPQKNPAHSVFKNAGGEIVMSPTYDPNKHNVGMGWYSLRNPNPNDSLFVMEPYCILPKDYDLRFCTKFKYIFTWASKAFKHLGMGQKIIEINHPSCKGVGPNILNPNTNKPWNKRQDEIVIIANNKHSEHYSEIYTLRTMLADFFHDHSKYQVSWYGQIPLNRPYYKGKIDHKLEPLRSAKFSICSENSYDKIFTHNYFTEKLPECWFGGAVPLYMGCFNIDDFKFPEKSYIDLRQYVNKDKKKLHIEFEKLLAKMESIDDSQYREHIHLVKNKVLVNTKLFSIISYQRVYNKMIQTFAAEK